MNILYKLASISANLIANLLICNDKNGLKAYIKYIYFI